MQSFENKRSNGTTRNPTYSIGLALVLSVLSNVSQAATPKPQDPAQRLNQQITTCLACHGTEGMKADPTFTVPKIGGQHSDYLFAALKEYKNGSRKSAFMQPQVAALTEKDLQALANYFGTSFQDRAVPSIPPAGAAPGGSDADSPGGLGGGAGNRPVTHPAKWAEVCGACHGETGLGNMPGYPTLASQYSDYLFHALSDYRSGNRKHPFMPIYAKTLSEAEMKEITTYLGELRSDAIKIGTSPAARAIESIKMVDIPAGEYLMGTASASGFNIGRPEHKVEIKAFRMGKYAVTFAQYDAFALDTNRSLPGDEGWGRGTRPVINVTLKDTLDFITWLNEKSGKHYRLPSESEREYAARAGSSTTYWWGDTMDPEKVNGNGIKGRDQWEFTAPVGQFPPNAFGLYDMAGNIWERTADCWHGSYESAPVDGSAWVDAQCHDRVVRGSYWNIPRLGHSTRYRAIGADAYSGTGLGFRLAEDQ